MNVEEIKSKLESFERGSKELVEYIAELLDSSNYTTDVKILKDIFKGYESELEASKKVKPKIKDLKEELQDWVNDMKCLAKKLENGESLTTFEEKRIEIYLDIETKKLK